MKPGQIYPKNVWFYVTTTGKWYLNLEEDYRKENDELTEAEANELGVTRTS